MSAILAFSTLVGPPALFLAPLSKTMPSTSCDEHRRVSQVLANLGLVASSHLGVVDGATDLLDHANVAEVDIRGGGSFDDAEHRVDGDGGEDVGVLANDLRGEAGVDSGDERVPVGEVDGARDTATSEGGATQRGLVKCQKYWLVLRDSLRLTSQGSSQRHYRPS